VQTPTSADVLVVGAGPAGSAAAAWAARAGLDVVLVDAATFPRDKTCGDGLTPRAIGEMKKLGLEDWLRAHTVNHGLRAHGFGQTLLLPWPGGSLPDWGSAVARTELDDHLRTVAIKSGARAIDGARAVGVRREGERVAAVEFRGPQAVPEVRGAPATSLKGHTSITDTGADGTYEIACRWLVVADGVRSPLGKVLGREWHRDTVYAVAGRAYVDSEMSDDPWISSHLELRDEQGELVSGYGWIFPLGDGTVNLGAGTLATSRRPAEVAIKPLMQTYADTIGQDFGLSGELRTPTSALLPMGGAVSNVAGPNWALIGDAAACVNPLNGEGIDYGLETGRLVAEHIAGGSGLGEAWRTTLVEHYGESFSIARRLAGIATQPKVVAALGPAGMRSDWLMTLALRWMGNLVDDADRDRAARVWRWAGRRSMARDARPPFS
jgi:geranylgeranyl reductase family protein